MHGATGKPFGSKMYAIKEEICMHNMQLTDAMSISLGIIHSAPTPWVLALFLGFMGFNFWSDAPKCGPVGGGRGVCVYFL